MADSTAMTIEFLRARLLSERSVSRSARQRADQLAKRVLELEEQLRVVSFQRRQAEKAANEVLSILESRGFNDFTETVNSYTDRENAREDGKCSNDNSGEIRKDDEASTDSRMDETQEESESQGRSLSWKSRTNSSDSSDKKKEERAKQRQRKSLASRVGVGSSPQLLLGKSCRKMKKTAGARIGDENGEIEAPRTNETDEAILFQPSDDQKENHLDVETPEICSGGDEVMERAIEHQDQLIDRFMAEENAQREWEQNYQDPFEQEKITDAPVEDSETTSEIQQPAEPVLESNATAASPSKELADERKEEEECDQKQTRDDHAGEMMDRVHDLNESRDDSRQEDFETIESTSDCGRSSKEQWSLIQNPIHGSDLAYRPREVDGRGAGNVLGALQRARSMLRQELHKFEPRREEFESVGIPFGPSTLFRLPSDINVKAEAPQLSLYSYGGYGDGITISTRTETRTSMAAMLGRNLGPTISGGGGGGGGFSSSFSMTETSLYGGTTNNATSRFGRRFGQ